MKFVSWNVNGLRAVMGKNFVDIFSSFDADFFCLQETKLQEGQIDLSFPGYKRVTGIMLRRRDIAGLPYLQSTSHLV